MHNVLTPEQVTQFHEDGYLVIPGVFPHEDILHTRKVFLDGFKNGVWKEAPNSNETIINDIFTYFPELIGMLFNPRYMGAITDIIGSNAVWIPECSIHRNRFIHWHKDTSIQERSGDDSHKDHSSPLIQAAIYFQENNEYGGGLTVLPGSHKSADHYQQMLSDAVTIKLYYKLLKLLGLSAFDRAERHPAKTDIPTRPGDLLLFDLRIDHRSSMSTAGLTLQDTTHDKLAIFNTFGPDNMVTRKYFDFMKQRPEPYYRYFREQPLPDVVYQKGKELNMPIWY